MLQILFDDVQNGSIKSTVIPIDLSDDDEVENTLGVDHGGTGTTSWTAGSVVFAGASGTTLTHDNANFFWDDTNNRLSLGLNAAATRGTLEIKQVVDSSAGGISIDNNVFTNTLRIWEDASDIGRIDGGALGNTDISINGVGAGKVGIGTILQERALHVKGDAVLIERAVNSPGFIYRNTLDADFPTQEWLSVAYVVAASDIDNLTFSYRASSVATTLQILHVQKTGNVGVGSTESFPFPSTGTMGLFFEDGTAPSALGTNTAGVYANDVSGTVEMFAINEAGTSTQLTGAGAGYSAAKVMQRIVLGI